MRKGGDGSKATRYVLFGGLLVLGLAWQHVQAVKLGYEVEKARRQLRLLQGRTGAVQIQLEKSLSPAQLASRAKSLGLHPPAPSAVRLLDGAQPALTRTWYSRLLTPWRSLAG